MPEDFPQNAKAFHRGAAADFLMWKEAFFDGVVNKGVSAAPTFASPDGLCYSNEVVSRQWSFPWPLRPALYEIRFEGKWKAGS